MYGCGIGPLIIRATEGWPAYNQQICDIITLREDSSFAELEALGVKGPK
jgi:polysaccharide pyruvyl transferase WcaK-like protein